MEGFLRYEFEELLGGAYFRNFRVFLELEPYTRGNGNMALLIPLVCC